MRESQTSLAASTTTTPFTKPVLRWAGGKSHLLPRLLRSLPTGWKRLVEPMAGSAALYLAAAPHQGILADINDDLINFYRVLQDRSAVLIDRLRHQRASKRTYYRLRSLRPTDPLGRAERFAYLNRLCWNGIFRVNKRGDFNVPIGDRLPKRLWSVPALENVACALRGCQLNACDFEDTLERVKKGDLVFLDPPYPRGAQHELGFNRYSPVHFTWTDHERLGKCIEQIRSRDAMVLLTMADIPGLRSLYPDDLTVDVIESRSRISCNGDSRRKVREIIARNFLV